MLTPQRFCWSHGSDSQFFNVPVYVGDFHFLCLLRSPCIKHPSGTQNCALYLFKRTVSSSIVLLWLVSASVSLLKSFWDGEVICATFEYKFLWPLRRAYWCFGLLTEYLATPSTWSTILAFLAYILKDSSDFVLDFCIFVHLAGTTALWTTCNVFLGHSLTLKGSIQCHQNDLIWRIHRHPNGSQSIVSFPHVALTDNSKLDFISNNSPKYFPPKIFPSRCAIQNSCGLWSAWSLVKSGYIILVHGRTSCNSGLSTVLRERKKGWKKEVSQLQSIFHLFPVIVTSLIK